MRILLADRQDITRMGLVHIIQQMNVGDKEKCTELSGST